MWPCQTWVIGSAVSDSLITMAMIYHVRRLHIVQREMCELTYLIWDPQLARHRRIGSWPFGSHALVEIVRLTVEANLLTSVCALVSYCTNPLRLLQPPMQLFHC